MDSNEQFDPGITETRAAGRAEADGSLIGRYRLFQKIGEGGMGEVWLAEQKEPVRRRVAIKLVKAGMNTREVIARFESERQALALMDHPSIATVLDAGSSPQGLPYFAMEYVAGVPITTYCNNHRLNTRERLELFMLVCDGVQHAHQKAIIHRDLKPSNILVLEVNGKASPKIIDFGVAKALTQKLTADTLFTRIGALIGTPEYMSPEQANSSGEDIDTRTDVYSLGVILYELLAGERPFNIKGLAFDEFLRTLREDDAPKPSAKIRTQSSGQSAVFAKIRRMEPTTLASQIRGDLDSITLKALAKDRAARYGSPSDFAADIARYLNNEPTTAVPPSAMYRARKFTRRYRVALLTTGAFALVLIAATVISVRQRLRANREAAVAEAVSNFLQNDLLAQAGTSSQRAPDTVPDLNVTVRTALDRAADRVAGKFDRQPDVEAAIRDTIGRTYDDLGLFPQSRQQLERALELRRRVLGPKDPKTLESLIHLGNTAQNQGKYAEASALFSQVLEASGHAPGTEKPIALSAMDGLGRAYLAQGKYAQAEALFRQALDGRRRTLGTENPAALTSLNNLAMAYRNEGKKKKALALDIEDLEIRRRALGPEHPNTLDSMHNLAMDYRDEGRYGEAEAIDKRVLDIRRRVRGPEHLGTLKSMSSLAIDYVGEGKYTEAEALDRQVLEMQRRVLGAEHPDALSSMNNLAFVLSKEGKYAQAEELFSQTLDSRRLVLGSQHPDTLSTTRNLVSTLEHENKYSEAEALFRQSLQNAPSNPACLNALAWYLVAVPDFRKRRPAQALPLARLAVKGAPTVATYYNTLGLAAYRNDLWDEAIANLNRSVAADQGEDPTDFFILAMAKWKQRNAHEAEDDFVRGVNGASKDAADHWEWRMLWSEAAEVLNKPSPVPTLLEAQAEPERAMKALKREAAAGQLSLQTLQASPDLAPLRGRADFEALVRDLRAAQKPVR